MKKQKTKSRISNMVLRQVAYEYQMLLLAPGVWIGMAWFFYIFLPGVHSIERTITGAGISVGLLFALWLLRRSFLCVYFSNTGRQLRRYGDTRKIMHDVNEQARNAFYYTYQQALTEKYIMLFCANPDYTLQAFYNARASHEKAAYKPFQRECIFYLVSTSELERVEIKENNPYAEEMNTLFFYTFDGRKYEITIYEDYESACAVRQKVEQCLQSKAGPLPLPERKKDKAYTGERRQKELAVYDIYGSYALKWKVFYGVTAAVVLVVVSVFVLLFLKTGLTFEQMFGDIQEFPGMAAGVAAMYVVPWLVVFLLITCMQRRVQKAYSRLRYFEQQEMDTLVKECPHMRMGDVIYGSRAFWFRDIHALFFQQLVFYEDVVWLYPAKGRMMPPAESKIAVVSQPMDFHSIVFYTKDGRKHSIFMADWHMFSRYFPKAIRGYGKEQKKAWKLWRRRAKKEQRE